MTFRSAQKYLEICFFLLDSFSCKNVITQPTRITCHSESLLDLFVTNNMSDSIVSGTIMSDLSDHFPIYMFHKSNETLGKVKADLQSHSVQDTSTKNLVKFRKEIERINWNPVFQLNSADEAYDTFMHSIKKVYHNCFNLKTVRTSKKIRKAWLTNECFEIIRKKNSHFSKSSKQTSRTISKLLRSIAILCRNSCVRRRKLTLRIFFLAPVMT